VYLSASSRSFEIRGSFIADFLKFVGTRFILKGFVDLFSSIDDWEDGRDYAKDTTGLADAEYT
jgi:hypothetical protein